MLAGVFGPGERVTTRGLIFAATPASDFVCGTLQLAAGMNMHVFTTGRGTPYGLAMAPVIKVSSRTALADRWSDLIDVDAGRIATGEATIQQVGEQIFRLILEVASGRKQTWADHWGCTMNLHCLIPRPSRDRGHPAGSARAAQIALLRFKVCERIKNSNPGNFLARVQVHSRPYASLSRRHRGRRLRHLCR